jgi:hypothetical protein
MKHTTAMLTTPLLVPHAAMHGADPDYSKKPTIVITAAVHAHQPFFL